MPLRSTERSDGRNRPRWKDGSQPMVGERRARQPTDVAITETAAGMTAHETVLARDRRWDAEADAGLQNRSWRGAQVRLAILPYGRGSKGPPRGIAKRPITDLSRHSPHELTAVAATLNERPRMTLNWRTPAEAFNELLLSCQQGGVATTP